MKHSNRALLIPVILFALLMQGCSGHAALNDPVKRSGFYFDTLVTITVYGNEAESYADDCLSMCSYYEGLLSMTVDGSDISRINNAGTEAVTVSGETIELLEYAMDCYDSTQGALDISVAPASRLWTDARKSNELPSDDSLSDAVSHIGLDKLHVDTESLSVSKDDPSLSIDAGALGKGFVADKIKDMLISKGVKSAVISLGGNILTIGSKPDGNPFKIGIKEPFSD
nr:FAD:protein FMN transferase [Lachnospiraceae bacterium]